MKMSNLIKTISLAFIFVLFVTFVGYSQSSTATLTGTVEDEKGAVIPGANVTIVNNGTGARRNTTTNESGAFNFPLLPPSTYTVTVEHTGFGTAQFPDLILNVGDQKALQAQLKVGGPDAKIDVYPDTTLVRTDGSVGTLIDRRTVENIPLNARSFQTLFELTPGLTIVPAGTSAEGGQFSVNGQRTNANYVTVDGVSANTGISSSLSGGAGQSGTGTSVGYTAQGTTASLVAVDALQEFRIQTSTFAPEFGRMPGGQISLVTRGGTNDYHGTLFEYFRNEAFDATDWFVNSRGQEKPPLRQNQFGGTFGGPIVFPRFGDGGGDWLWSGKDKAFFFFSYEALRLQLPKAEVARVPSLDARQRAHDIVKPYLNAWPIPNGRDYGNGFADYAATWNNISEYDATSLRFDYNIAPKHSLFARYGNTPSFTSTRPSGVNVIQTTNQINKTFTVGSTSMLGGHLANDLRVNYTINDAPWRARMDTFGGGVPLPASVFAPGTAPDGSSFTLTYFLPMASPALILGTGTSFKQRQINIVDGFTISSKDHTLKFGADFRRINPQFASDQPRTSQLLGFSNDVLQGVARAREYTLQFANQKPLAVAFDNLSLYAQDTWKVTPRLTLTYGLRWEFVPPPHATEGEDAATLANLDDIYGGQVHFNPPGTPLWKTRYGNFAPRVGVSYLVSNKQGQELVVRGGFGMYHDLGFGQISSTYVQYPFAASNRCPNNPTLCPGTTVSLPLAPVVTTPPGDFTTVRPTSFNTMDPNVELPFTYQWNIAAERSFGAHQTLTVSWVGAEGRKLLKAERTGIVLQGFANPQTATGVIVNKNLGYSDYRALQVQFQRRMHRNFQSLVSYTLGRSHDTDSSDTFSFSPPSQRSDFNLGYASSDFDVRHIFTGAVSFQVPKLAGPWLVRALVNGWGIDSIFRARTGFPINPFIGVPWSQPGFPNEVIQVRPNVVAGEPFWLDDPTVPGGRRLNILAFRIPPANVQGDLPRNSIRGFGARQIDVSLRRDFRLRETAKLQLRWDVFNIFNTPHFGNPSGQIFSATSMQDRSTSTLGQQLGGLNSLYQVGGPRSMQFSARVVF